MPGRPVKRSADWFPHDAHASGRSKTLTVLENHYGSEGYMAWFKLLERLTATDNHTIACESPEETEFLAAKLGLNPERFDVIMAKIADLNGIDRELWKEHRVIWCQNLVDNLKPVYDNRKQEPPHKPGISTGNNAISRLEMPISILEIPPPQDSCSFLTLPPPKRERGRKERGREEPTHPTLPPQSPDGELVGSALESFRLIEANRIKLKGADLIEARRACLKYSPEWIREAVRESCVQNKTTWKYAAAILRRWESEGRR